MIRKGHPLAAAPSLSLADFGAANHARVIAAGTGHGRTGEALSEVLARQDLQRRIRLTVPLYGVLDDVLGHSDLIATVPERFAQRVTCPFALTTRALPLTVNGSAIHQFLPCPPALRPGAQVVARRGGATLCG